jgi:type II secretory pathway component PulF
MAALFHYTARSREGAFVNGSLEAVDAAAALSALRGRALFVTSLEAAATLRGALAVTLLGRRASRDALVAFFRTFSVLVRAGVPIRRSLSVTIEQCDSPRLREALDAVATDIENGLSLSEALLHRPREFSAVHAAMICAGEAGGVLDEVLERLAAVLERDRSARKRLVAALTYPAAVGCAAFALLLFLVTSVVPMFRSMFEQFHVPVPPATAVLLAAGTALQHPAFWFTAASCLACCAAAVAYVRSSPQPAAAFETALMRLPVIGAVLRKSSAAAIARMLGALLRSGVGMLDALEVLAQGIASRPYRESLIELRRSLAEGSSLTAPLSRSALYDPLFVQMVRAGEETGALDAMLLKIADYYDVDVEASLASLAALIEPALMLILGTAVAFIAAAVFVPLYSLVGNVR